MKEEQFRREIVGVWDRTVKVADIKNKLQRELGIAANDDKLRAMMQPG